MPRLVVFGYRCSIGSDDLSVPSVIEGFLSSAWLGWFAHGCYRLGLVAADCFSRRGRVAVYGLLIGPAVVSLGLSIWKLRTSLQGTVINEHPRRLMPYIIVAKLANDLCTVVALTLNTMLINSSELICDLQDPAYLFLSTAVNSSWFLVGVSVLTTLHWLAPGIFNESGFEKAERAALSRQASCDSDPDCDISRLRRRNLTRSISITSAVATRWKMRFLSLGKLIGIENHPMLKILSDNFLKLFKEEINLVPTDVLSCLILMELDQCIRLPKVPQLSDSRRPSWMNMKQAARYIRFASAAYGWPMYALRGPVAFASLVSDIFSTGRVYTGPDVPEYIVSDNAYMSNTEVIRRVTGLKDSDIIYVSFHNKLFELPFYIALDHKFKSIVISIRGTLSIEDILVDLLVHEHEPMSDLLDMPDVGGKAHDGMLASAEYIYSRLVDGSPDDPNSMLLNKAQTRLEEIVNKEEAKTYTVMVTGQSLGAGVAAILTILLRERNAVPDARCFAYSPPGGLLTMDLADSISHFVCSVILSDDIVGRLGIYNLFDFKVRLLSILKDSDLPKHEIFGGWLMNKMCQALRLPHGSNRLVTSGEKSGADDSKYSALKYKLYLEAIIQDAIKERDAFTHLYLPGSVLYIQEILTHMHVRLSYDKSRAQDLSYETFRADLKKHLFRISYDLQDIILNLLRYETLNLKPVTEVDSTLLPGKEILSNSGVYFTGEKKYAAHFCKRDDPLFTEILISSNVVAHHVPWAVMDALDYLEARELEDVDDASFEYKRNSEK